MRAQKHYRAILPTTNIINNPINYHIFLKKRIYKEKTAEKTIVNISIKNICPPLSLAKL
jgi:hypothetical protein